MLVATVIPVGASRSELVATPPSVAAPQLVGPLPATAYYSYWAIVMFQ